MPHSPSGTRRSVARVVLTYAVVAGLWILLSDWAVEQVFPEHGTYALFGTLKGLVFVAATAGLLWAMLRGEFARRAEAVAALEESELRYRTLFERSQVPMLLVDPAVGRLVDANPAACSFHGYPRERMRGLALSELNPLDLAALDALIPPGLAAGRSSFQLVHRLADGSLRDVVVSIAPITVEGRELHFAILHDVTERLQAEASLREATQLLNRAQALAHVGSWRWDIRVGRLEWSDEMYRIFGLDKDTFTGVVEEVVQRSVHPSDRAAVLAYNHAVVAGEPLGEVEYRIVRPDGSERVVSGESGDIVRDATGVPIVATGIVRDLTDRKHLEQQLFRSQRMEAVGALASGIAHDLNNVLTPVMMIAPMLKGAVARPEDREMLVTLEQCAQRGADIIRQLLTFARGEPGARARLPLRHLLREMDKIVRETFPREIGLTMRLPRELWSVEGDVTQMHQVLMNLCINARDAMPAGGRLLLSAANVTLGESEASEIGARPGPYVRLTVADTGVGIAPEHVSRIFDPFFTTKAIGKGTGLGLSTVLGIVRGHGGVVRVDSRPGQGSTFDVYLPASEVEAEVEADARPLPQPGRGEVVLVVDDEDSVRLSVSRMLEAGGYRTVLARNGREALELLPKHADTIRLVLTDMMMPVLNGSAFIAQLRAAGHTLPVVTMTGVFDRDAAVTTADVTATLTKPFGPRDLLRTVARALDLTVSDQEDEADAPAR